MSTDPKLSLLNLAEELAKVSEEEAEIGSDNVAALLSQASVDIEALVGRLDYVYRCITSGYRQGVFDFSRVKAEAFEFTGLKDDAARLRDGIKALQAKCCDPADDLCNGCKALLQLVKP
jgi:hypothetical protein